MNNETYNLLKEVFPSLPKDKRSIDRKLSLEPSFCIDELIKVINEIYDKVEKKNMPVVTDIVKIFDTALKNQNIDLAYIIDDTSLSDDDKLLKILVYIKENKVRITDDKIKDNVMLFIAPILYQIFDPLLDSNDKFEKIFEFIRIMIGTHISYIYSLSIRNEISNHYETLYKKNIIDYEDYQSYLLYFKEIKKYNQVLDKLKISDVEPLRLFPYILLSIIIISMDMLKKNNEEIFRYYGMGDISPEEKDFIRTYFSGFMDFYNINKNTNLNKKIIFSSHIINLIEKSNNALGNNKLSKGALQLLWHYIKINNQDAIKKIVKARRKSLDIFLNECRVLYKKDKTNVDSAKSRYDTLKKDKEAVNEDEYNAFLVVLLFLSDENYQFRHECITQYYNLAASYNSYYLFNYINSELRSRKKYKEQSKSICTDDIQNNVKQYLYDFMSYCNKFFIIEDKKTS